MPYLATLAKVKLNSWIRPMTQIRPKNEGVLPWLMLHLSTKFHGNRASGGSCVILLADRLTENISPLAEVNIRLHLRTFILFSCVSVVVYMTDFMLESSVRNPSTTHNYCTLILSLISIIILTLINQICHFLFYQRTSKQLIYHFLLSPSSSCYQGL